MHDLAGESLPTSSVLECWKCTGGGGDVHVKYYVWLHTNLN